MNKTSNIANRKNKRYPEYEINIGYLNTKVTPPTHSVPLLIIRANEEPQDSLNRLLWLDSEKNSF
ncbi:MAG: hypothetical protein ACJAW1_002606 [Glaciecola sp.]|jgi:hypothetical protein